MKIEPFGVELWMNEYENTCAFNLAETCVEALTVIELLELCGADQSALSELLPLKLTYGAIEGSDRLRTAVASLYRDQRPENLTICHGTIGANALVYESLVSPGDRVVSLVPAYQQHISLPESYGAEVHLAQLRPENNFLPDYDELAALVTPETTLISLTNPNNPAGALIDEVGLQRIAELARSCGAYVLCDEVYRGIAQTGDGFTASIVDVYERGIATAGMSKAYSLAGTRVGWVVAPREVLDAVAHHRDYNTISVGMINDHLAALALENRDAILARNHGITRTNLALLDDWVRSEPKITYVRPTGGTTAILRYDIDIPSRELCVGLLDATGVMLTPGSVMGMEGWLRIGFANDTEVLRSGLPLISTYLASLTA